MKKLLIIILIFLIVKQLYAKFINYLYKKLILDYDKNKK